MTHYMVLACGFELASEVEEWLNRCAAQGYRLIAVTPQSYYIFARQWIEA